MFDRVPVFIDDKKVYVSKAVGDYINKLRYEYDESRLRMFRMETELEAIKPVIEHAGFKAAVSTKCEQCKFAYFSKYDHELIGCAKDMVCSDYVAAYRKDESYDD